MAKIEDLPQLPSDWGSTIGGSNLHLLGDSVNGSTRTTNQFTAESLIEEYIKNPTQNTQTVSKSYLENDFGAQIVDYISTYCSNFVTADQMESYVSDYVSTYAATQQYVQEYCSNFVTRDALSSYVSELYLTDNNYLSQSTFPSYFESYWQNELDDSDSIVVSALTNFTNTWFSDYLANENNAYLIYEAISQYIQ